MGQEPAGERMSEKETSAFGVGLVFGIIGVVITGAIAGFVLSDCYCTIRGLKSSAVEYGYASWVTGQDGDPVFQWKVPVEKEEPQK